MKPELEKMQSVRSRLRDIMNKPRGNHFVYSLTCPIDKKVRWVGYTQSLSRRFEIHWYQEDWSNILKWGWILVLNKVKRYPEIKLLKAFDMKKDAIEYENFMIFKHRSTVLNKKIPKY